VQVSARKADEKSGLQFGAGLSTARKEMLVAIHAEEDEPWQSLSFYGEEVTHFSCFSFTRLMYG